MRKSLVLVALCAVLLSGCASIGDMLFSGLTGHSANPKAAPDRPTSAETTETGAVSTRDARIQAGLDWLWKSVARLREKGVASDRLDELTAVVGDIERLDDEGKSAAAVELFGKAWSLAVKLAGRS